MPEIARFYGIIIRMYFSNAEHNPPHIHAIYQKYIMAVSISDLRILSGTLPPRAKELVLTWVGLHKEELQRMWDKQEFEKIEGLD